MANSSRAVTIKDVAEKAGVAISTVSRVINDMDRVSEDTRIKVRQAMAELGFVKNDIAASMITGITKMIVVVVPDIINEYYTSVIHGVEEIALQKGYYTLVFSTGDSKEKEEELFDGKFERIIDGAIFIPSHGDMSYYKRINKPIVIVDRYITGSKMDSVVIDNYGGSFALTSELIKSGHKKIAIVIGPQTFNIGQERFQGFVDAMNVNNIPINEKYVKHSSWYTEDAYEKTLELLELDDQPTAIVATNNLICFGCIKAIAEKKRRIGKDISLVGFDDSLLAEYVEPGITVIRRPTVEMGRIAASKLIDLIENKGLAKSSGKNILNVELIRRSSVAKLKK